MKNLLRHSHRSLVWPMLFSLAANVLGLPLAMAAEEKKVAKVVLAKGEVKGKSPNSEQVYDVTTDQWIVEGTLLQTNKGSVVKLRFMDNTSINLGPNSKLVINQFPKNQPGLINLVQGQIRSKVVKDVLASEENKTKMYVKTKTAAMGIRGTDFQVVYNPNNDVTSLVTFEGQVQMVQIDASVAPDLNNYTALETHLNSDKAVSVSEGQYAGASNQQERVTMPVKISPAQLEGLKGNENMDAASADKSEKKQYLNPIPPGITSKAVQSESKLETQLAKVLGTEATKQVMEGPRPVVPKGPAEGGPAGAIPPGGVLPPGGMAGVPGTPGMPGAPGSAPGMPGALPPGTRPGPAMGPAPLAGTTGTKAAPTTGALAPATTALGKPMAPGTADGNKAGTNLAAPVNIAAMAPKIQPPPEGGLDRSTGAIIPPAGGFLDLHTGLYVPPPPGSVFDSNTGVYVPPASAGGFDPNTGQYTPPQGFKLSDNGQLIVNTPVMPAGGPTNGPNGPQGPQGPQGSLLPGSANAAQKPGTAPTTAATAARGPDGKPIMGPDGKPMVGPAPVGPDGKPMLAPGTAAAPGTPGAPMPGMPGMPMPGGMPGMPGMPMPGMPGMPMPGMQPPTLVVIGAAPPPPDAPIRMGDIYSDPNTSIYNPTAANQPVANPGYDPTRNIIGDLQKRIETDVQNTADQQRSIIDRTNIQINIRIP